ncbi:MAG: hypothetical protein HY692_05010 [Cyanobacteria bacterium NC_groundwater_1444_Ag_S-0.65um_54_12]|nr:hypothetical protein [Cyanobacteria bacterium NC_groundwater_1444_Ag_S-0.65um_54_12]
MSASRLVIGQRTFNEIRPLGKDLKIAEAKAITARNGIDEIYFEDRQKRAYVAYREKSTLAGVRAGYLGRYGEEKIKVIHVDDEANTFQEGARSVFTWTHKAMGKAFGEEAVKVLATTVSTLAGGLIAATALKDKLLPELASTAAANHLAGVIAPATEAKIIITSASRTATMSNPAPRSLVNTVINGSTTASRTLMAAAHTTCKIAVPIAAVLGGALLASSLIAGVRAGVRQGDRKTIDMVTDRY